MIDCMRKTYGLREVCEALGVSRSAYYASKRSKQSPRCKQNQLILTEIQVVHSHRHMNAYGSPRMTKELNDRGIACGRHRGDRIMRENDIRIRRRKAFRPRTTQVDKQARVAPNHLANAPAPQSPGQLIVSDITYLRTRQGWLYLTINLDLFSRAIISRDHSDS